MRSVVLCLSVALPAILSCNQAFAANSEILPIKTTLVLSAPLPAKENDALPPEIRDLALPIANDSICQGVIVTPTIGIVRADLPDSEAKALLPESKTKEKSLSEKVAGVFGKKPSAKALENSILALLETVHVAKDWAQSGTKPVALQNLAEVDLVKQSSVVFVLPAKPNATTEDALRKTFADAKEVYLVNDNAALRKGILKSVCAGGAAQSGNADATAAVVVIYKPALEPPVNGGDKQGAGTTSKCNQDALVQGIQFLSLAEGTQNRGLRQANLNNAFQLFNRAVEESKAAGECCGKALMNRGIVRDYLQEPRLALEDLKAAADGQCGPPDKDVLFNLACHYSKHSAKDSASPEFTLDFALQTLEKAVGTGFKDCDILMGDKDLSNLRSHANYKDRFRKMLNQHGLFCTK
jgi:hypothetical protein